MERFSQHRFLPLALRLAGCGKTLYAREHVTDLHVWNNRGIPPGFSKRPFSKAAASEEARRYIPHFVWAVRP
jgi:hypothetical protein